MLSELQRRCVDISYKYKLTHLSSVLSCVDEIDKIYSEKGPFDPFILSNGHAGVALYAVLEKYYKIDAEKLYLKHGVHPHRDLKDKIWCSTGSLGQGVTVGVGMALANRKHSVYVMTSDGEMEEGCCWEALKIAKDQKLENLKITCIANGHGAYRHIDTKDLDYKISRSSLPGTVKVVKIDTYKDPYWMQGIEGHYVVLNEDRYKELIK